MSINRITYFTDDYEINIRKYGSKWHLQVMTGIAATKHVETKEFDSLPLATGYVRDKYAGGIEV